MPVLKIMEFKGVQVGPKSMAYTQTYTTTIALWKRSANFQQFKMNNVEKTN